MTDRALQGLTMVLIVTDDVLLAQRTRECKFAHKKSSCSSIVLRALRQRQPARRPVSDGSRLPISTNLDAVGQANLEAARPRGPIFSAFSRTLLLGDFAGIPLADQARVIRSCWFEASQFKCATVRAVITRNFLQRLTVLIGFLMLLRSSKALRPTRTRTRRPDHGNGPKPEATQ